MIAVGAPRTGTPSDHEKTGTIADVSLPAAAFALGDALTTLDHLTIEIESTVAAGGNRIMPMIQARGADRAGLETALQAAPDVEHVRLLSECENAWFYRIEWNERVRTRVWTLIKHGATILAAMAMNGRWQFRLLCPDRSVLSRTHDACVDAEFSLTIERVYDAEGGRHAQWDCRLTDAQREALVAAFEGGYYSIPRGIDLVALAEELGISHQALSERLRRATEQVVETAVMEHET